MQASDVIFVDQVVGAGREHVAHVGVRQEVVAM